MTNGVKGYKHSRFFANKDVHMFLCIVEVVVHMCVSTRDPLVVHILSG